MYPCSLLEIAVENIIHAELLLPQLLDTHHRKQHVK